MQFFRTEDGKNPYLESLSNHGKVRHILNLCGEHGRNGLHASDRNQYENELCNDGEDGQPGQDAFNGTLFVSGNGEKLQIQVGEDISEFPLSSDEIVLIRCIGGNGGNGGDGQCNVKKGMIGGRAGNGGNGGDAGDVIICTESPILLAMIEIENRGGKGGFPGVPSRHSGSEQNGQAGNYGEPGLNGSLTFHITSSEAAILESGASKFSAAIISILLNDSSGNGMFEPGSDLIVDEIRIMNDGDLSLPSGARLTIQTAYCPHPVLIDLPRLNPREEYIRRQIHIPLPWDYTGSMNIYSAITLANRLVGPRCQLCLPITVQHPIRLRDVEVPLALGPGEEGMIKITLENISEKKHGRRIDIELQLNEFLRHSDKTNTSSNANEVWIQHKLSPVAVVTQISNIESHSYKTFELGIHAKGDDDSQRLYSLLPIRVKLFLNGRSAESALRQIRCIPNPLAPPPPIYADVLLLTSLAFSRLNYCFWKFVSSRLGLSILTYNVDLDFPEHTTAPDYLRKCRFIIAVSSRIGDLFRFPSHFISQHLQNNPSAKLLIAGLYDRTSIVAFLIGLNYLSPIDYKQHRTWNFSFLEERFIEKLIREKQTLDSDFRYYVVNRSTDDETSVISCCGLRRRMSSLSIHKSLFPVSFKLHILELEELSELDDLDTNISFDGSGFFEVDGKRNFDQSLARLITALLQLMTLDEKMTLLLNSGDVLLHPSHEQPDIDVHRIITPFDSITIADLATLSLSYDIWKKLKSDCDSEADILESIQSLSYRLSDILHSSLSRIDIDIIARATYIFELPIQKLKRTFCFPNHRLDTIQLCLKRAQKDVGNCSTPYSMKSHVKALYRKWNRTIPILFKSSSLDLMDLVRTVKRIVVQDRFSQVYKPQSDFNLSFESNICSS